MERRIITGVIQFPKIKDNSGQEYLIEQHPKYRIAYSARGVDSAALNGARASIYGDFEVATRVMKVIQYRVLVFPNGFVPITAQGRPGSTGTSLFPQLLLRCEGQCYYLQGSESIELASLGLERIMEVEGYLSPKSDYLWVRGYRIVDPGPSGLPTAIGIVNRGVEVALVLTDDQGKLWSLEGSDRLPNHIEKKGYMGGKICVWGTIITASHASGVATSLDAYTRVKCGAISFIRKKDEVVDW